jgi:hypothetical protein
MSEEHSPNGTDGADEVNRRNVLKLLGTGTIGAAGLSGMSSVARGAKTGSQHEKAEIQREVQKASQAETNHAIQNEEVKIILNEIGNPAVQRGKAQRITINIGDVKIQATTLPTPLGEILYSETNTGVEEVTFTFGNGVSSNKIDLSATKNQLPAKYRTVPFSAGAKIVVAKDNKPVLIRSATPSEKNELSQMTGIPTENMVAGITSRSEEFRLASKHNLDAVQVIEFSASEPAFRELTESDFEGAAARPMLRTQRQSCWDYCTACAEFAIGAAGCQIACGPFIFFGGLAGVVACVVCATAAGIASGYTCSRCLGYCV